MRVIINFIAVCYHGNWCTLHVTTQLVNWNVTERKLSSFKPQFVNFSPTKYGAEVGFW